MAVGTAILLSLYFVGVVYALLAPARQPDPQRGMAVGCLWIVAGGLLLVGAVLAAGVLLHVPFLVRAAFFVTVLPLYGLLAGAASALYRRLRRPPP